MKTGTVRARLINRTRPVQQVNPFAGHTCVSDQVVTIWAIYSFPRCDRFGDTRGTHGRSVGLRSRGLQARFDATDDAYPRDGRWMGRNKNDTRVTRAPPCVSVVLCVRLHTSRSRSVDRSKRTATCVVVTILSHVSLPRYDS